MIPSNTQQLENLCKKQFGTLPTRIEKMPQSGSNRGYYLIEMPDGQKFVGTIGNELDENKAFISFAQTFYDAQLAVPQIISVSDDGFSYLQSYVEGKSLFEILEENRNSDGSPNSTTIELYKKVLTELLKFQTIGAEKIDFSKCYPRPKFDRQSIMWDLNYFKYFFLKTTHTFFDEQALENDFNTLCDYLLTAPSHYFMYRDFQSRNIIVTSDGKPYFIDFQGGRRGALQYDVASLIYDGKAAIPPKIREELLNFYVQQLKNYVEFDEEDFRNMFYAFAYVRIMQACGSYGYRGFTERKQHFLKSIPPAMKNINYLLNNHKLPINIPQLEECLKSISENESLLNYKPETETLTVTVMSFSYKKGIPYDPTGNGGGFVFDCRAIHNPGRYSQYLNLTGKDQEVIEFFSHEPEMDKFVKLTQEITDISIDKYLQRGFKNLSVLFGCTGGQHRSVYSAECMAQHIRNKYPSVIVKLSHREQDR